MVVLIVLVCFSPQTGFSPLWAAYFSAEALLLLGTFVFAVRRRGI
jgi:LPXTG-motif cell wall-anchored protein